MNVSLKLAQQFQDGNCLHVSPFSSTSVLLQFTCYSGRPRPTLCYKLEAPRFPSPRPTSPQGLLGVVVPSLGVSWAAARRADPQNYRGRCTDREALPPRLSPPACAPAPAIMAAPLALVLVVAVTVRAALFRSSLAEFISERVEVVSPLSSWKRGEATGSSRRPGPACAPLASVNGRRGQWPHVQDSEGTHQLSRPRAGERGC